MSNFNFVDSFKKAAESVKRSTRCSEHGESPTYQIIKTSKGANAKWTCCCDNLKDKVEKKFADECARFIGDDITKSITDIFK